MIEVRSFSKELEVNVLQFLESALHGLGYDFDLKEKDKDLSDITSNYKTNGGCFLTAICDNSVLGTIGLRPMGNRIMELKRFYVSDIHRGQGIGSRLLSNALEFSRNSQFEVLRLDTTRQSVSALALFNKLGFAEIKRYNSDPYAEVFMELRIR